MSTSSNQWYVEMSAGITLGPMPFDDVVELAETSAIMRDDRVREESSKGWKSARDVAGLFRDGENLDSDTRAVSLPDCEVAETPIENTEDSSTVDEKLDGRTEHSDGVVRLDEFQVLLGESATTADHADDPAAALLHAAASLETVDPETPPSSTHDVPDSSLVASEPETAETDSREARPSLEPAMLVNERNERVEDEPAPATQPPAAASPQSTPRVQPWRPPVNRNRQLAVRGCLALAAVAGVWSLFSLLKPDIEAATYVQYAAIYQEYQTLVEVPDSGSWSEFATRARAELDETLPNLEAAAVPGERSKSLLLYAGRDLRTALDLPPGTTTPHAGRLAGFFEQLNELHASSE